MLWLKRNIVFAVSLLVAVGLFGFGCFYAYTHWKENSETQKQIEQADADLKKIYDSPGTFPSPTNIAVLRQQEAELRGFLTNAVQRRGNVQFDPNISASNFKTLLDNTLAELSRDAERVRVAVTQKEFSFASIKPLVSFVEGSVPLLAEQLAEVKLICNVLFHSEITSLDSIRREPVSKDDVAGVGSLDYHNMARRTNELTGDVSSFYLVSFQGFSESLASALDNIGKTPEGLSVRLISVLPAGLTSVRGGAVAAPAPVAAAPIPQRGPPAAGRPGGGASTQTRRLETLADEKSFRVAALLEVTKSPAAAQVNP
jgi:hypothetical protein